MMSQLPSETFAPAEVRASEAFPVDPLATVEPVPTVTIQPDARLANSGEDHRASCVPDEPRSGTA